MFTSTSSLAAAACTLFAAVSASPDAFPFTNEPAHQLVNRADVIITTGATGGVEPRLEISNLATRDDQWALYIKAMSKWMQAGEDDTSGYYDIASIHGVPFEDWNGATQCDTCSDTIGYGTHDMVIFPTWHRTYVAHFEQNFLATALEVAESYPASSRDRMVAACKTLRFPYWDWAAQSESNSTVFADLMTSEQITINGPDGQETLDNPLYSFTFSEAEAKANYYSVFTSWLETLRYPTSDAVDTTSDEASAQSAFTAQQSSLQDQVYQMLTACDDYLHFSNDDAGATAKCANSIETIHNTVHTLVGGAGTSSVSGGHMTYLPLSSYDPVFFLHHCNVDRLFALWQTINPDSYVPTATAPHSTWVIPSGATLNADYPLEPFNKDASSYWTSNDVRDWTALGYTYPEFTTSSGDKSDIATYINGLYGNKPTLAAGDISALVPETQVNTTTATTSPSTTRGSNSTGSGIIGSMLGGLNLTLPTSSASSSSSSNDSISNSISSLIGQITTGAEDLLDSFIDAATGNAYEYSCYIQTPRYALNGSYYVWVFNGAPTSESPAEWHSDSHLIGMMGVLSTPDYNPGHDMLISGEVPLTRHLRSLVTLGSLVGMDEDTCLPFLTKNLEWRISRNGEEIDCDTVEGFSASVYSSQSSVLKAAGELPSYTKYAPQVDVTKGKSGGAKEAVFGPAGDDTDSSAPSYSSGSSSAATWASTSTVAASYGSSSSEASPVETAASYGSGSSSAAAYASSSPVVASYGSSSEVSPIETASYGSSSEVSPIETASYGSSASAPSYGSASSAPTYEASSAASATGAYSWGSYAPSASSYVSLATPSTLATAPASVIPSAFETSATASQPAETCAVITTTVKHVETVYITQSAPAATGSASSASSSPAAPVESSPVAPVESSPVYNNASSPSAPVYGAPSASSPLSVVTVTPLPSSSVENSPVVSLVPQHARNIY